MRKRRMTACWPGVAIVVLLGVLSAAQGADKKAQPGGGTVALTFDDLPAHGPLPPGVSRVQIARSILEALKSHGAPPAYGFVNARLVEQQPADEEILRLWRAAGHPLGNHTFSHMDLNANPIEAFEQDVVAGEALVRAHMGDADWRWLRFPFLRAGDTPEKHRRVLAFLGGRGYRVAEVTINFDDYAYHEPYARCLNRNDARAVEWLERSYLSRASDSLTSGQAASRTTFGRDIKHVMLLHVGGFQVVMLPRLLDLLRQRGWTLTTLPDAASDPAYARAAEGRTSWTGTFLDQQRPAGSRPDPRPPDDVFEKLAALCR